MKKLYLISQNENTDYDTYDSMIVCAENKESAIFMNPSKNYLWHDNAWWFQYSNGTEREENDDSWTLPKNLKVKEIGIADEKLEYGIILASFNAG